MAQTREKFAIPVNSEILTQVRSLSAAEDRPIQALVEEALVDLLEKHNKSNPRAHVVGAYLASNDEYDPLYKKLAE